LEEADDGVELERFLGSSDLGDVASDSLGELVRSGKVRKEGRSVSRSIRLLREEDVPGQRSPPHSRRC